MKKLENDWMKSVSIIALVVVMSLTALAGCGGNQKEPPLKELNGLKPHHSANTQISNPFQECANLDEAAKLAGFPLTVPNAPTSVQVMDGTMIQADYENGMCIRKAPGSEDISGDYNDYSQVETKDGLTLKGEGDTVSLALWTKDGYSYSVSVANALSKTDMLALIADIM